MRNLFLVLFFFLCIIVAPIDGLAQESGEVLTLERSTAAALAAIFVLDLKIVTWDMPGAHGPAPDASEPSPAH